MNRKEVETLIESLLVSFGVIFISVLVSAMGWNGCNVCISSFLCWIFTVVAVTYYRFKFKRGGDIHV